MNKISKRILAALILLVWLFAIIAAVASGTKEEIVIEEEEVIDIIVVEEPVELEMALLEETEEDIIMEEKYVYFELEGWDENMQTWAQDICDDYEVPYALLLAVVDTESDFRKDIGTEKVLGHSGSANYYGYCQLSIDTCRYVQNTYHVDPHTEYGNIEAGTLILSEYLKKYDGDVYKVVAAYRAGENAMLGMSTWPKYVRDEVALYEWYDQQIMDAMGVDICYD